ncbi:hypothetical protein ACSNOH_00940 [Streptomyces sp. URMC 127]|uniref:hypothetical protein n=1 Tax=Streptomyces sp. URMC 127 TaxID=3423402 RepID=UPI003F1A9075
MTGSLPGFRVVTGDECSVDDVQDPAERAAAVRQVLEALRHIREVVNPASGRPVSVPAQWERLQPVRAISIALESAGIPASSVDADGRRTATGYRVHQQDATTRVEWKGPPGSGAVYEQHEQLQLCARVVQDLGWQTLEYRGAHRHRWLEVEAPPP